MMLIDSGLSASDISTRPQGRDKRQWLYAPCDIEVMSLFMIFSLFYSGLFNSLFVAYRVILAQMVVVMSLISVVCSLLHTVLKSEKLICIEYVTSVFISIKNYL